MKYYKLILSNKQEFYLDETDYEMLKKSLDSGSFVRLKKAIINPSFIVAIIPSSQRDALDHEALPDRDGYVDMSMGRPRFVVKGENLPALPGLKDEFKKS